ncbi:MAG: fibronectin type III domain-containing protein [Fimbriimonadales bacterium]
MVGSADGNGLVELTWSRNGNIPGTTFAVEMRTDPNGAWEILGVTTKVKFDYLATPGSYVAFRVTASRNGLMSPASTPFALWENGGGQTVALKLAA